MRISIYFILYIYLGTPSGWVDFLRNPAHIDKRVLDNKDIEKAIEELEYISTDDEERAIIESIQSGINDQNSRETIARNEGKEEGLKEGKEEGLKQGKEEMARNMLKDNVDITIISRYTGLTIKEIQGLTNNQE